MKSKMKIKMKIAGKLWGLSAILLFVSCAKGFDDNETFSGGVTNAQLESPVIDDNSFSTLTNSDGTESVKITWPVVMGAGGYLLNVDLIEDPADPTVTTENPVVVMQDSVVDGSSVVFTKTEDATYKIKIKTLGNEKLNNKEAQESTDFKYVALVPATTIPVGEDIAEYINNQLKDSDKEQAFALEAGKSYVLNGIVDFRLNVITLRSTDKDNRPTVKVGASGGFMTQAGLKIKFINFDCSEMTGAGFLTLSGEPSETISIKSLGYDKDEANQDGYIINKPVIIQECNIKNLQNSLLYGNKKPWTLRDFRITDCIVQMNNAGSNGVINLYGATGTIKDMTIKNSTFYNLVKNSSAYFIRYQNNSQPWKYFGKSDNTSTHIISNNTFCKTFSNKDFGNNIPNDKTSMTQKVEYNIFYDVYRLYQYLQSNNKKSTVGNTIWGVDGGTPNGNDTGGRKDDNGNPFATLEDPAFVGPFLQELDLLKTNGGVDFEPKGAEAVKNRGGDPRWYK